MVAQGDGEFEAGLWVIEGMAEAFAEASEAVANGLGVEMEGSRDRLGLSGVV